VIEETEGFILNKLKYGDNNFILKIFTERFGKISFFIYNPFSKKALVPIAFLEHLNPVKVSFDYKNNVSFFKIKSFELNKNDGYFLEGQQSQQTNRFLYLFLTELINNLIIDHLPNPALYHYLSSYLDSKKSIVKNQSNEVIYILIDLIQAIGFETESNWSKDNRFFHIKDAKYSAIQEHDINLGLNEENSLIYYRLITQNREEHISIPKQIRQDLIDFLLRFIQYHQESFTIPNSLEIIRQLF
jgi:DNA repair protein RecO (recombination protein O)